MSDADLFNAAIAQESADDRRGVLRKACGPDQKRLERLLVQLAAWECSDRPAEEAPELAGTVIRSGGLHREATGSGECEVATECDDITGSDETAATVIPTVWQMSITGQLPEMTIRCAVDAIAAATTESLVVGERNLVNQHASDAVRQSADYELLDIIGTGGMGVVYAARQASLGRVVAVKMLKTESDAEDREHTKFLQEAAITGDLQHPNIVPIYELSRDTEGHAFYAMKRVIGTPWKNVIKAKSREENLEILMRVADAMAFAHSRGILHRDLKPENVMLGDFGEVLLMDWGLALILLVGQTSCAAGAAISMGGTPAYMAPEMVLGPPEAIGTHSDVYLLGAILFEIVTGLRPHVGNSATACIEAASRNKIQSTEHSGELMQIAMRAMETRPTSRFTSVLDFQKAIRNYLSHAESLALTQAAEIAFGDAKTSGEYSDFARSLFGFEQALGLWDENEQVGRLLSHVRRRYAETASDHGDFDLGLSLLPEDDPAFLPLRRTLLEQRTERNARQGRLRRLRSAMIASTIVLMLVLMTSATWIYVEKRRAESAEAAAIVDRNDAVRQKELAETAAKAEQVALKKAQATLFDMYTARGLAAGEANDSASAAVWFASASQLAADDPSRQRDSLRRARNWLQNAATPIVALNLNTAPVSLSFSPDGRFVAALGSTGALEVVECLTRRRIEWNENSVYRTVCVWLPDSSALIAGNVNGELERLVIESSARQSLGTINEFVTALAVTADGRHVFAAGQNLWKWDSADGSLLQQAPQHPDYVTSLVLNSTGELLCTACKDGKARVFGMDTLEKSGQPKFDPVKHTTNVPSAPVFVDHGRGLITVALGSTNEPVLEWRDANTGEPIEGQHKVSPYNYVARVSISPDEKRLAATGYMGIAIWNLEDDTAPPKLIPQRNNGEDLAFSPDSNWLVTAGWVGTSEIQSVTGEPSQSIRLPHEGRVLFCDFSPDGRHVATAQADGIVRIWRVNEVSSEHGTAANWGRRPRLSFDGTLVTPGAWHESPYPVVGIDSKTVSIVDVRNSALAGPQLSFSGTVIDSCIASDNQTVVVASSVGLGTSISAWDISTGKQLLTPLEITEAARCIDCSPATMEAAILTSANQVLILDLNTMNVKRQTQSPATYPLVGVTPDRVCYSPDGQRIVRLDSRPPQTLTVLDANTCQPVGTPIHPVLRDGPCRSFTISPDSKKIATAVCGQNAVQIWDLETGVALSQPYGHPGDFYGLFRVAFSPDNTRIASAHVDGHVRVWDWQTGEAVCPPLVHKDDVFDACFLEGGRLIATVCRDGIFRLWETATGRLFIPPVPLGFDGEQRGEAVCVAITDDSQHCVVTMNPSQLEVLPLAAWTGEISSSPASLIALAELASGARVSQGELTPLTGVEWLKEWETIVANGQELIAAPEHLSFYSSINAAQLADQQGRHSDAIIAFDRAEQSLKNVHASEADRLNMKRKLLQSRLKSCVKVDDQQGLREVRDQMFQNAMALHQLLPVDPNAISDLMEFAVENSQIGWRVVEPVTIAADSSDVEFQTLDDQSILTSGPLPATTAYDLELPLHNGRCSAIRLEVLPDDSLPGKGSGRYEFGLFKLTKIILQVSDAEAGGFRNLPLQCWADFSGAGGSIQNTLNDSLNGWHVYLKQHEPHYAIFSPMNAIAVTPTDSIKLRLEFFGSPPGSILGRFRISVTDHPAATLLPGLLSESPETSVPTQAQLTETLLAFGQLDAARKEFDIAKDSFAEPQRTLLQSAIQYCSGTAGGTSDFTAGLSIEALTNVLQVSGLSTDQRDLVRVLLMQAPQADTASVDKFVGGLIGDQEFLRLNRAIARSPNSTTLITDRANLYAMRRQWMESVADLRKRQELAPEDRYSWLYAAPRAVLANDREEYNRIVTEMLSRFGNSEDPGECECACKIAFLIDNNLQGQEVALRLQAIVDKEGSGSGFVPWGCATLAMAAWRDERLDDALRLANQSLSFPGNVPVRCLATSIKAHVLRQLGQSDAAAAEFKSSIALLPAELKPLVDDPASGPPEFALSWCIAHDFLIPLIVLQQYSGAIPASAE